MKGVVKDDNVFPYPKEQYSLILPPGKTMEAIITPTFGGFIPIYDRRLNLTNAAESPGGMLTYLRIVSFDSDSDGYVNAEEIALAIDPLDASPYPRQGNIRRVTFASANSQNITLVTYGYTVHSAWVEGMGGSVDFYFSSSTDNGYTCSGASGIVTWSSDSRGPDTAVDSTGVIHIVYADNTPGNYDLY